MNPVAKIENPSFMELLREQRWDDHRFYHHSRVNQSLHFLSALTFLTSYVMLAFNPGLAVFLGWIVAMTLRQTGHFFFEPKTYDFANQASHEEKESIKVGYNLFRKSVLIGVWAAAPIVLYFDSTFFGLWTASGARGDLLNRLAVLWLAIGVGAIVFRMVQLAFSATLLTGLVWGTKILTDPFHDVMIYWKAPLYLFRGELYDPIVTRS